MCFVFSPQDIIELPQSIPTQIIVSCEEDFQCTFLKALEETEPFYAAVMGTLLVIP